MYPRAWLGLSPFIPNSSISSKVEGVQYGSWQITFNFQKKSRIFILGLENFKGSEGWLDAFKRRHKIDLKAMSGVPVNYEDDVSTKMEYDEENEGILQFA